MRASTVSDVRVDGTVNLAGIVTGASDGYLWVDFSHGTIAVPGRVAADTPVFAVLRVLPSGRSGLSGVIVNGTRY
ncbi:MAG TPA: hypothetical protein VEL51_05445 [Vicinamibacterales bacterium]|nr:hypothetical protein [Vicinamibacterales bacterium]